MWVSLVFALVPLVQLNVLAAEAYVGNGRSWNTRNLNLPRRPLLADPNPISPPIHEIPRPLPKPVETPFVRKELIAQPAQKEIIVPERQVVEHTIVEPERSNDDSRSRFNLPIRANPGDNIYIRVVPAPEKPKRVITERLPAPAPTEPAPVAPIVIPQPALVQPEPAPVIPEPTPILPERTPILPKPVPILPKPAPILLKPASILPKPAPVLPEPAPILIESATIQDAPEPALITIETVPAAREPLKIIRDSPPLPVPANEPISSEDIEIITHASPAPSSTNRPTRHYLMPRPIPRPSNIHLARPSVTIVREEPKTEKPKEIITEKLEVQWVPATTTEQPALIESTTFIDSLFHKPELPKLVPTEVKPIEIIKKEEPELIETPVKEVIVINPTRPDRYKINPDSLARPDLRKRRPATRKPVPLVSTVIPPRVRPMPLVPTIKPLPMVTPSKPLIIRTTLPPAPTTVMPPRVTVTPKPIIPTIKPLPLVTSTKQPPFGRSTMMPPRPLPTESTLLADYHCDKINAYYGVANECDTYVECKSYTALMSTCPDGLHFNRHAIWPEYPCSYPSEVKCEGNSIKQKAQPTEDCPRRYGLFPMPDSDCSRYLMCQEGLATVMDCPPGLVFNPTKSACDWLENVPSCHTEVFRGFTCPAPPIEEDGSISDMIFKYRYNQSCKEYVACQRGHPRLLRCDPGLSFDEESQYCVDSEYVLNCRE